MVYQLHTVKILIVEDMHAMLTLTKSLLSIFGFQQLITAKDGEEGFEAVKKHDPDVVITDWLMEPKDGLEMISEIRKNPLSPNPYVPVILMTGYSDIKRVESARDMGVTEFLVKPYTARDLYSRIVQIIEKPRQFVDAGEFFGPDRRRKKGVGYSGPHRRQADEDEDMSKSPEERRIAAEILNKLRKEAEEI